MNEKQIKTPLIWQMESSSCQEQKRPVDINVLNKNLAV